MKSIPLIVDAHVHTYPNAAIGRRALGPFGYGYSGTIEELKEVIGKAGLSQVIMANMTPVREMLNATPVSTSFDQASDQPKEALKSISQKIIGRLQRRNQWTCELAQQNPGLVALISVDVIQSPEEMIEEVDRKITDMGAKGLKLHPIANEFYPWDHRLWPLYAKAQNMNIPILFHSGDSELPGYARDYAQPKQFAEVAQSFPQLPIILAHLGRGHFQESIELARNYANIFFDISGCLFSSGPPTQKHLQEITKTIKQIGPYRILYGSDWPWFDPLKDLDIIKEMDFSTEEKAMILGLNAKRIYRL